MANTSIWNQKRFLRLFMLIALGALLTFGGIVFLSSITALDQIEQQEANLQWLSAHRALSSFSGELQRCAEDLAARVETRRFLAFATSASSSEEEQHAAQAFLARLEETWDVSLVMVIDPSGLLLFSTLPETEAGIPEQIAQWMAPVWSEGKAVNGFFVLRGQPFLLAAAPISRPGESDPSEFLILGRPIDKSLIAQIKATLGRETAFIGQDRSSIVGGLTFMPGDLTGLTCLPDGPQAGSSLSVTRHSVNGIPIALGPLAATDGSLLGCLALEILYPAGETLRPALTISTLIAILLGLIAAFILSSAVGNRFALAADNLSRRERESSRLFAEVKQLNSRLESMVSERTSQLRAARTELQEAQNQLILEDRLAALGTLTAGVAQEIGAQAATIMRSLHSLLSEDLDDSLRPQLEAARLSALTIHRQTSRLRSFSSRQSVRAVLTNLNDVVSDVIELQRFQLEEARITWKLELEPSLPRIMVDPIQIQQVLFNIVANAREALEGVDREREIHIRSEEDNGKVRLLIIDNGPGIEPADEERLFEPSFSTKSDKTATGLGLFICQSIVNDFGGIIRAEKNLQGVGAVFRIEFPSGLDRISSGRSPGPREN